MYSAIIFVVSFFSVTDLKGAECTVLYKCYTYSWSFWEHDIQNNIVTNIWCENNCRKSSAQYQFSGTISDVCYCRKKTPKADLKYQKSENECKLECPGNRSEICGGSHNRITVSIIAKGEWSLWNDWKFCEVNCVREDTTNGTQRRWRTCNGSKCSGKDMEERSCSESEICKGMRPKKLLCKCPKRLINTKWHSLDGKNITNSEVKKMVLEDFKKNIKSEISVDKKTVSKEVRKKKSSVNKRKSAQSIGWGCIVFLILPMVFLIAIDILNCCIHFRTRYVRRKRKRIATISVIKDHGDSAKGLQENVDVTEEFYASRCGNNLHPDEMKLETYQRRREDQQSRMEWMQYI